jgi:hypothetical protein
VSFLNRLCLVTDVKGYSTRSVDGQADAQKRLLLAMTFALRHAGFRRVPARDRQDRGDGRLYALPSRLDEARVIPRLILGLQHGLYLANQDQGAAGRLRIRAALARGALAVGVMGWVGQPAITSCRMVDSQVLKDRLDGGDTADLALIVTEELYQDVIKLEYPGVPSGEFTPVSVTVKEYTGTGWVYLPVTGPAVPPGDSGVLWGAVLAGGAAGTVLLAGLPGGPWGDPLSGDGHDGLLEEWELTSGGDDGDSAQGGDSDDHSGDSGDLSDGGALDDQDDWDDLSYGAADDY